MGCSGAGRGGTGELCAGVPGLPHGFPGLKEGISEVGEEMARQARPSFHSNGQAAAPELRGQGLSWEQIRSWDLRTEGTFSSRYFRSSQQGEFPPGDISGGSLWLGGRCSGVSWMRSGTPQNSLQWARGRAAELSSLACPRAEVQKPRCQSGRVLGSNVLYNVSPPSQSSFQSSLTCLQ